MWVLYAVLSALFAALTALFAKVGVKDINSNLATAIRTVVILIIAWGIVIFTGAGTGNGLTGVSEGFAAISRRTLLFLVLSGAMTGLSWLCYFKAIQEGPLSIVAPIDKLSVVLTVLLSFIVLGEPFTCKILVGMVFIVTGVLIMIFWN